MLAPAATAVAISPERALQLRSAGATATVAHALPDVQAASAPGASLENGFEVLPAAAAPSIATARAHPTVVQAFAAAPAVDTTAARLAVIAPFAMTMQASPSVVGPVRLQAVTADRPSVALVAAGAPKDVQLRAPPSPLSLSHQAIDARAASLALAQPAPRIATSIPVAAPAASLETGVAEEPAAPPAPIFVAAAPYDLATQAAPAVERRASLARVKRRTPRAVLVAERAPRSRARLRLSAAPRLFLDAVEAPVNLNAHVAKVARREPATVLLAQAEAPVEPGAGLEVLAQPSVQLARYDAPVTTEPRLLSAAAAAPDLTLTTASASSAAPAQAAAEPVSAVTDTPAAPAAAQSAPVIELAQASPAPAPSPPASEAPAPDLSASASEAPAAPPAPPPPAQQSAVVRSIAVQGNERIEASTILSYLPIAVGDTVDAAKLDLAVKTLYRTDLFSDVSMEMHGAELVVKVSENPIINQVVFEGNHAIKEDKLRDEVSVRPRGIFTRSKVEEDAQKIIELYRRSGRISATVTPKIVQLPQKRVDLIFEINEGPKSGIVRINFVGNKTFSDNALRDVIVTRESHWYKFFQSNDNYDPDRIEYDREQLRKFYRNHGFYDFRIISAVAELAPDKNGFVVTFTVDEGPKYHFGKLKVTTELKRLNGELLQALLPIRSGELYEDDRIEKATDALTYAAGANGFAFVDVRPRYVAHPETRTVDVNFDIKEGPRVYIERIDIVGNTRTLDYVIRRQMRVAEGDAYNRVLVDRSKQAIKALGFFKDVDIEQLPGTAPDKTILRVKVTEQPTGQLTFSVGYSTLEKLVGDIGISETNFRGRGQTVDFEVSMGYLQKRVSLSFTEPQFLGRNMSAGFDVYTYAYNYATTAAFTSSSTGITLRTGFPLNQYTSVGFRYSIHSDNVSLPTYVYDPASGVCAAGYSQTLCDELGRTFTSSVGYTVAVDRRNDPIIPTRGYYLRLDQDFAGLGGVRYIRTLGSASWFYGFTPKWILTLKGQAGYITGWGGDSVRINDRFFEGGDTFRGFQIAGLGPRDTTLQSQNCISGSSTGSQPLNPNGTCYGDALGAKAYAIGTVELQFPNLIPAQYGIKTALFTDFGTIGILDPTSKRNPDGTLNPYIRDDLAFRASVGISVFWKSPMGPLRFDFSKVLKKTPYDVPETFFFSTATSFQ